MKKLKDITIILDRSGSMDSIKDSTIEGYNSFLSKQKSDKTDTNLTLVQFDHEYQMVYQEHNIKDVKFLNNKSYEPRGITALLDAIGITINLTKERLRNNKSFNKKNKIIIAIITDGYENASEEFSRKNIFKMIRLAQSKYKWSFLFLGANQDAICEGERLGIHCDKSLTFHSNERSVNSAFYSMSNIVCDLSENSNAKFSYEDRELQKALKN